MTNVPLKKVYDPKVAAVVVVAIVVVAGAEAAAAACPYIGKWV